MSATPMHKGRHQHSLPLTTNFSQKLTQPSKGISYPVGDLCRRFTKRTLPSAIVIRFLQQMVQMVFCDLSHTYHKQVTNVSLACCCHPTVGNFDVSPNCCFKGRHQNTQQRMTKADKSLLVSLQTLAFF